jgi:carboxymethylenebutenolidase
MKTLALSGCLLSFLLQDPVQDRLNKSPRHQEWVAIKVGDRTLHAYVVFPEVKEKAPAIVVIHENKGLSDWVRSAADQFAEAGVIAIAPDLLSGLGPAGGKTSDFPTVDAATQALYKLPPDQVTADLNACTDYVAKLDACNGKLAVAGFCWGGRTDLPLRHQPRVARGGPGLLRTRAGG